MQSIRNARPTTVFFAFLAALVAAPFARGHVSAEHGVGSAAGHAHAHGGDVLQAALMLAWDLRVLGGFVIMLALGVCLGGRPRRTRVARHCRP